MADLLEQNAERKARQKLRKTSFARNTDGPNHGASFGFRLCKRMEGKFEGKDGMLLEKIAIEVWDILGFILEMDFVDDQMLLSSSLQDWDMHVES